MSKNGGRFQPGVSGNPAGRPKMPEELKTRLRGLAPSALDTLEQLLQSEDERVRLSAAQALLDRAYGKPSQEVALENTGNASLLEQQAEIMAVLVRARRRELQWLDEERRKRQADADDANSPASLQ